MNNNEQPKKYAFDVNEACYCSVCERHYKNYKRFCIHMKKVHYPNIPMNNENTHPQEPQVKSAEEIRTEYANSYGFDYWDGLMYNSSSAMNDQHMDDVMNIFASQFKSEPTEELKEEARKLQETAITLTHNVKELQKEIERLKSEPKAWTPPTKSQIEDQILAQGSWSVSGDCLEIAKWVIDQYLNSQRKDSNE